MKRLTDKFHLIPTSLIDIYRYFGSMLIHMPKDALKTFENHLLYSKKRWLSLRVREDETISQQLLIIEPTRINHKE